MDDKPIILFDGVCNLCNNAVQFVLKHDKKNLFRFASLQSDSAKSLLIKYDLHADNLNSVVLIQNGKAFTKSAAALSIAKTLSGPVKILYGFIIVPPFIRNAVYTLIADNRYRWFGKKDNCMFPSPDVASRFLN